MTRKTHIATNIVIGLVLIVLSIVTATGGVIAVIKGDDTPIYRGNPNQPNVSLMINVYWGTEFIEPMLSVLENYGAKCTFFLGGSWVDDNNETVLKIRDAGHELANHGYFHKDHKKLNKAANREEITACEGIVEGITGYKTALFAPPSGSFSTATMEVSEELGYKVVMWSKDTIDWRDKNTELILRRATDGVQSGDLILMHPTANTLEALPSILDIYKNKGLNAVTVSECIAFGNAL